MQPQKNPFIVEIKLFRRLSRKQAPSLWQDVDLQQAEQLDKPPADKPSTSALTNE
jgi:hypothetical protein